MKKVLLSAVLLVWVAFSGFVSAGTTMIQEYYIAANDLAQRNIISQKNKNEDYRVEDHVLRQEIAAVARGVYESRLGKEIGSLKKSSCDNVFDDVSVTNPNSWACYSVEALVDNDLISRNTTFRPEDKITKAETLGMLIKAIGFEYEYNPNSSKGWQEQIVDFAVENDVLERFSDYNTEATRGWVFQVATHVIEIKEKRVMEEKKQETMSDEAL